MTMARSVAPDVDRAFARRVAGIVHGARIERGWSQETLARNADVSTANIRRLEKGSSPAMSFVTIGKLSRVLQLSLDTLFTNFSTEVDA